MFGKVCFSGQINQFLS